MPWLLPLNDKHFDTNLKCLKFKFFDTGLKKVHHTTSSVINSFKSMGQKDVKPQHPKLRLKSTDPDEGQTEDGLPRSARKDGRFVIPWRHEKPKISFMKYLREPDHSNIPSKQV